MSKSENQGRWEFDQDGNVHFVPPDDAEQSGQYHYSYSYGGSGQKQRRNRQGDDGWHWLLIVLGFMAFWPVGLVLLFLQLSGKWPGSQKVEQEFRRAASAAQNAAKQAHHQYQAQQEEKRTEQAQQSQQAQPTGNRTADWQARHEQEKARKPARQDADAGLRYGLGHNKLFRGIGIGMTALFGFCFVMELIDQISAFAGIRYLLTQTMPLLALCLMGLTFIGVAGTRKRKLKRFLKYRTLVGSKDEIPIAPLARAMGVSDKKAEKDLDEMLDRGFFEAGYVDASRHVLVLHETMDDTPEPEPASDDTAAATLRRIRQINDAIPNPELSAKIDRIEELTAKIFKLVEERPEKASELRSFMNYYLPQTLKILESYSKLEAQGIEGENIAEAKAKIEAMMDKLVDGYETQLDKLFADDVMDISADLKVMESMLEKDGLTSDSELKF